MDFDGLSIANVVNALKSVEQISNNEDSIFKNLNKYLHNRMYNCKLLDDEEKKIIEDLVFEIERLFFNHKELETKLLEKVIILRASSSENKIKNIADLDIKAVAHFCKREQGGKDKYVFKKINGYLVNRIRFQRALTALEKQDIDKLVFEIERRFFRSSQKAIKKVLLNSVKTLLSIELNLDTTYKNYKFDLEKLIELCSDVSITDNDCFNVIIDTLDKVKYFGCLLDEKDLVCLQNLASEIKKRFWGKEKRLQRAKLEQKIRVLQRKAVRHQIDKINSLDLIEVKNFFEKIGMIENNYFFRVLNKYVYMRIVNERFFRNDEMKVVEKLKETIEKDIQKGVQVDEKKKLHDKLVKLQFLKSINLYATDLSNERLIETKKILVQKGKNSDFYSVVWDISAELSKENIDFKKLKTFLVILNGEMDKVSVSDEVAILLEELFHCINDLRTSNELIGINDEKSLKDSFEFSIEKFNRKFRAECDKRELMEHNIRDGKIVFSKNFPLSVLTSVKFSKEQLEVSNKIIFAIDGKKSLVLDGAYSVVRDGDCYVMDVYVTDVPTFLRDNREVCEEAYKRGRTFYVRGNDDSNVVIEMLPKTLSVDYLSLLNNRPRKVLDFQFIFDNEGRLILSDVSRKQIRVTYNLTPVFVEKLLFDKIEDTLGVRDDILLYEELIKKVLSKTEHRLLSCLRENSISDYVSFSSIFTNYFVANNSQFLIYRDQGKYTSKPTDELYSHSVTPLRKFVSDINLAFFLNQEGIVNFSDKDLNYVENNIEQIIEHLNYQEELNCFAEKNGEFVKKHIL